MLACDRGPSRRFARRADAAAGLRRARARRLGACTKAWFRTSSTSSGDCPASVPRAPSGSPSTCSPPTRPTYAASSTRSPRSRTRSASAAPAATSPRPSECRICLDPRRDLTVICVVEEPKDVVAVERTREFRGRYHVLGGAISPIEGIGPDDLRVRELMIAARRRHGHRADPRHRPEPRGRGDGHLPRAAGQADGPARHPARQRPARSVATWSTPTRSRSGGPSREGGCSMSDRISGTLHVIGARRRARPATGGRECPRTSPRDDRRAHAATFLLGGRRDRDRRRARRPPSRR